MSMQENQIELRKEIRRPTRKGGRIVCPEVSMSYDCQIRNISAGGAKIEISQWCSFPKNIVVEIGRLELVEAIYEVEVCWTDARHLGVKFLRKLDDSDVPMAGLRTVH